MKITLLVDEQPHEVLQSEFGLSLLLKTDTGTYLFDTGADRALLHNLDALKIPRSQIKKVILSHGHYDHTGALAHLQDVEVFCHSSIMQEHYSFHSSDDIHNISMPEAARTVLAGSKVNYTDYFAPIEPGLFLTGSIDRNSTEDCGGKFFHDHACTEKDIVHDEQSLLSSSGVLITGCCHAGIINTLEHCRNFMPQIKVHTIIGGLHLRNASLQRLSDTAGYLQQQGIKKLYLLHCTGKNAVDFLREALHNSCQVITPNLGDSWEC